jgi:hypothetical protein
MDPRFASGGGMSGQPGQLTAPNSSNGVSAYGPGSIFPISSFNASN